MYNDSFDNFRSVVRDYQRKIESYSMYCNNKQKKHVEHLVDNVNLLMENIDRLPEIDILLSDLKEIAVPNSENNLSVSNVREKIYSLKRNLNNERNKTVDNCVKLYQQLRTMMRSLYSSKEYRENCEEVHISFVNQPSLKTILVSKSDNEPGYTLGVFDDEIERHEKQQISDGIIDADRVIKDFQQTKKYLDNSIITVPVDSMKILISKIKEEEKNITAVFNLQKVQQMIALTDELKKSSSGIADLKYIKGCLENLNASSHKQISELISFVDKTIESEEKKRNNSLMYLNADLKKLDYATQALYSYKTILTENIKLEIDKEKIESKTHPTQEKIERTKKNEQEVNQEINQIRNNPKSDIKLEEQAQLEKLKQASRENRDSIEQDEKYIRKRMEDDIKTSLPEEYVDMRTKLRDYSTLKKVLQHINIIIHNNGNKR